MYERPSTAALKTVDSWTVLPAGRKSEHSPHSNSCASSGTAHPKGRKVRFLVRWCLQRTGRWQPKQGPPQSPADPSHQGLGSASKAPLPAQVPQEPPDPPGAGSRFSPVPQGGPAGLNQLRISRPRSHQEQTVVQTLRHRTKGRELPRGGGRRRHMQMRKSTDRRTGRG